MSIEELERLITAIIPNASIETDDDGQIVIYTDLFLEKDGKLRQGLHVTEEAAPKPITDPLAGTSWPSVSSNDWKLTKASILESVSKHRITPGELEVFGIKTAYVRYVMEKLIDSGELEVDDDLLLRVPLHRNI